MNKQEVIEKIKALKPDEQCLHEYQPEEWEAFQDGFDDGKCYVELIVEQLDEPVRPPEPKPLEPEKPVVPQYVADFYESIKDDFEYGVYELCVNFYNCDLSGKIKHWFDCNDTKPIQVLVNIHQFGYEVEKEKLYTAKLKLTNEYLGYESQFDDLLHYKVIDDLAKKDEIYHFTEDDLVKYHIWGNDTYEVTEVEE